MKLLIMLGILWFLGIVLYRDGLKYFLFWLALCVVMFYFVHPSLGLWGFLLGYCGATGDVESESKRYSSSGSSADSSRGSYGSDTSGHRGSLYRTGGDVEYYSGGNSHTRYGDVTYFSNGIHSVDNGSVTNYLDDDGRRLGYSVDRGNGVHVYFDDDGRELGHSYTSGRMTDFIGDCFELR